VAALCRSHKAQQQQATRLTDSTKQVMAVMHRSTQSGCCSANSPHSAERRVARFEVVTETPLSCFPVTSSRVDTRVVVVTLTSVVMLLPPLLALLLFTAFAVLVVEAEEDGDGRGEVEKAVREVAATGVGLPCVVPAVALLQRCRSDCSCCCCSCRRAAAVLLLLLLLLVVVAAECEEGVDGSCTLFATSVSEMPFEAACSAAERLRRYRPYSSAQLSDASACASCCFCCCERCCVALFLSATARARAAR
jgi:hypothetical protein